MRVLRIAILYLVVLGQFSSAAYGAFKKQVHNHGTRKSNVLHKLKFSKKPKAYRKLEDTSHSISTAAPDSPRLKREIDPAFTDPQFSKYIKDNNLTHIYHDGKDAVGNRRPDHGDPATQKKFRDSIYESYLSQKTRSGNSQGLTEKARSESSQGLTEKARSESSQGLTESFSASPSASSPSLERIDSSEH